jgi:hypothetical protein
MSNRIQSSLERGDVLNGATMIEFPGVSFGFLDGAEDRSLRDQFDLLLGERKRVQNRGV